MDGQVPNGPHALKKTLLVLSLFVACLVWASFPGVAHSQTSCFSQALTAQGYFFSSYESVSYTPDGLPEVHLKINEPYTEGRSFFFGWSFANDTCENADIRDFSMRISLPAGVSAWSIRFTSKTHFDVWDDQHQTILFGRDIDVYPDYDRITFSGLIDGGASTFSSRALELVPGNVAPLRSETLPKPAACPGMDAPQGYYFDPTYERAEYIDGLLQIHLRLKVPYNDGRNFSSGVFVMDSGCVSQTSLSNSNLLGTHFTPHMAYYSLRMASLTHYELWNDESNVKLNCTDCQGDIPAGSPFVGWTGYIDGGASYIYTTPFPPVLKSPCTTNCFSNVLFLPGIESSRLYKPGQNGSDERLWEPSGDASASNLVMNANGTSVRDDIYTKDVIDEAYKGTLGNIGQNFYKSFITDMDKMRDQDHLINDWETTPYDWRQSLDQIIKSGSKNGNSISYLPATSSPYILQELKRLAGTSRTGKVTIIAHSNGGLVAKALLQSLGSDASIYVDKLILVAVPQLGTPKAVGALLHGYELAVPFTFSAEEGRVLGENMPGTYTLLPSAKYVTSVIDPNHPLAQFDNSSSYTLFRSNYGGVIGNSTELHNFLTGAEGRPKPEFSNLVAPNRLNETLLTAAESAHTSLDAWTPPSDIQTIQIAGWGVSTVAGINYYEGMVRPFCAPGLTCQGTIMAPTYSPFLTEDGDGTVVVPSALFLSTATPNVKRYWVNLDEANGFLGAVDHARILELEDLRSFVKGIIKNETILSSTVVDRQPSPLSGHSKLHFFLHSPLSLDIYDNFGRHTGFSTTTNMVENNIPGTRYERFGEVQLISDESGIPTHLRMRGNAQGSFSLNVEEQEGETITATTTFAAIPTDVNTQAGIDVGASTTLQDISSLRVDINGDGINDYTLTYITNGVVTIPQTPLTVVAEEKSIVLGSPLPLFTTHFQGLLSGDSAGSGSITGSAECATTLGITNVGTYPISCTQGTLHSSLYNFVAFVQGSLKVTYRFDGFLQPINDTSHQIGQSLSVFKAGSTVPVKLQLKKVDGGVVKPIAAPVWLAPQKGSAMSAAVDESVYSTSATSGNTFTWDAASQQYTYNWSTKGLQAGYWYKISAQLDDGTIYSVTIGLK